MSALPGISDINLLGYGKCIVYLDAKVTNCAFDLRMSQKQLDSSQISGSAIDECRLGSTQRVGTKNR